MSGPGPISKDFGSTKVWDYDPVADTTLLATSSGPDGVLGAGVSTCASLEMPKMPKQAPGGRPENGISSSLEEMPCARPGSR